MAGGSRRCPLSACWNDFQTNVRTHYDWSPPSERSSCFQSVLSHPDELADVRLELQRHAPRLRDQPAVNGDPTTSSRGDPSRGTRSRIRAKDGDPAVRLDAGPDTRRRRSVDDEDEGHRVLCSALT